LESPSRFRSARGKLLGGLLGLNSAYESDQGETQELGLATVVQPVVSAERYVGKPYQTRYLSSPAATGALAVFYHNDPGWLLEVWSIDVQKVSGVFTLADGFIDIPAGHKVLVAGVGHEGQAERIMFDSGFALSSNGHERMDMGNNRLPRWWMPPFSSIETEVTAWTSVSGNDLECSVVGWAHPYDPEWLG